MHVIDVLLDILTEHGNSSKLHLYVSVYVLLYDTVYAVMYKYNNAQNKTVKSVLRDAVTYTLTLIKRLIVLNVWSILYVVIQTTRRCRN